MTATDQPALNDRYTTFIQGLELHQIGLVDARVENRVGPGPDGPTVVDVQSRSNYRQEGAGGDRGLIAFQDFLLTYRHDDTDLGVLQVMFGVAYRIADPVDDDIWAIFRERNLPVNVWPFLREYVSTTLGRMGWTAHLLPAFKDGAPWEEPDDDPPATSPDA